MKTSLDPSVWSPNREVGASYAGRSLTYGDQHLVKRLSQLLREQEERLSVAVASGSPTTLEAYREMVGKIQGLKMAREFLSQAQQEINQGGETATKPESELYVL